MARRVKFALEMKDGFQARNNIDEIRDNFDYGKIVGYFTDGRLQIWLTDRDYQQEADALAKISTNDADFKKKICTILHVDIKHAANEENVMDENLLNRLEKVKQYTADKKILDNIAKVATNQEELLALLNYNESIIYLCANTFVIPLVAENVTYIGIGNPTAVIRSTKMVDFAEGNICFQNVKFNDEYLKLCEKENANQQKTDEDKHSEEESSNKGEELWFKAQEYKDKDKDKYLQLLKEAAMQGDSDALFDVGYYYEEEENIELAKHWYENAIQAGNTTGCVRMGHICCDEEDFAKVEKYYKMAADKGDGYGMYYLGYYYEYYQYDEKKAMKWYRKGAETGNINSMIRVGRYERNKNKYQEAMVWFTKAVENGEEYQLGEVYNMIGLMYDNGEGVKKDAKIAFSYFEKSANVGYGMGIYNLAQCYEIGDGVGKDWDKAWDLYSEAAQKGNESAKKWLSRAMLSPKVLAELLGVIINGRLKNGTLIWKTKGEDDTKRSNFDYDVWSDKWVNKIFPYYNGDSSVIGGVMEGNVLQKDEYLIFTSEYLFNRDALGNIIKIYYKYLNNVTIVRDGDYLRKLIYETNDNVGELDRSYLWDNKLWLDSIRLYLLVVAKLLGECEYSFTGEEMELLRKIRLESLDGMCIVDCF